VYSDIQYEIADPDPYRRLNLVKMLQLSIVTGPGEDAIDNSEMIHIQFRPWLGERNNSKLNERGAHTAPPGRD
jgi:hypothetical protein